jgi:hypothetical protein
MFDLLTSPPPKNDRNFQFTDLFKPWKHFMPAAANTDNGFKMPEISEDMIKVLFKAGNAVSGIHNGRKNIDFDFED